MKKQMVLRPRGSNDYEDKNNEERARDFQDVLKVVAELARRQMMSGVKCGAAIDAADVASQSVGWSANTAKRASKVVVEIDELEAAGQTEEARELRELLNRVSVNAAYVRLTRPIALRT